ncbi:AsmA family protein [Herbaspirillum sp. alder98]|uniref:AsmA family protein n=1 Tax=Herbaspirillum sp. alder98 TaxID=2913096 RepID=UPI001CD8204B|nr:AsmA family protein [Herbaspirillum sp. alder98]MCA1325219.1 AsmA family protein [Herbaspirillum sp. alder98]
MHHRFLLLLRILAWTMAALAGLAAALALFVANYNWNHAKPWLTQRFSEVLQREIRIDGDAQLAWAHGPDTEPTSTRFIPRLRLLARDVTIGNPSWATADQHLARAASVDMTFDLLPLLRQRWNITDLHLVQPVIVLERDAERRKNWRFTDRPEPRWSVDIRRLAFDHADIRYVDRPLDLDLRFDTTPLSGAAGVHIKDDVNDLLVQFGISGKFRDATVDGAGQGGALIGLLNDDGRFPLRAEGKVGKTHVVLSGVLPSPRRLLEFELKLGLSGDSLADLYPATRVPLPATAPFQVSGQLSGARADLTATQWDWHYRKFAGSIGHSDIRGEAQYLQREPRPILRATIQSDKLMPGDLVPSLGQQEKRRGSKPDRTLSSRQFDPEKWDAMDADITVTAQRVEQLPKIALQDLRFVLHLKDRLLTIDPLHFALAEGRVDGRVTMDARQKQMRAQAELEAQALRLRKLFPSLASMQGSFGQLDAHARLAGTGNSIAALLASAEGGVKARVSEGAVSKFILEAAGLNVADAVFAKLYRDRQVHLNCAVADIDVKAGQAHFKQFVVDTDDAVIDVTGHIDLAQEQLDLDIRPQSRELRVFTLRTPLYAKGPFSKPEIAPYKGPLLARAGAAAALALVAPVAAALPLISMGKELPNVCAQH